MTYGNYELPFGHDKQYLANSPNVVNEIVGGWELSPVINWSSGLPFTLGMNQCASSVGGSSAPCYPNGDPGGLKTNLGSFNPVTHLRPFYSSVETAAGATLCPSNNDATGTPAGGFTCPGLDQIGNVGRNSNWGPSFFNTDLALQKNFPIKEHIVAQFRMDAFNAFNHIDAANPNTGNVDSNGNVTNGAGGNGSGPVGQSSPRQLSFSLRVQF